MDIASIAAIIILVFITLWWVLRPLWGKELPVDAKAVSPTQQLVEELMYQRDTIYTSIKDLEQDLASQKVSESDYNQRRIRLTQDAAQVLKQLDTIAAQTDADIEQELDDLFNQFQQADQSTTTHQAILARVRDQIQAATNGSESRRCPNCQSGIQVDDAFCSQCGTSVNHQCPQCEQVVLPTDRFCAQCGFALLGEAIQ